MAGSARLRRSWGSVLVAAVFFSIAVAQAAAFPRYGAGCSRHGSHNWPKRQGTLGIEHAAAFLRRYLR